MEREIVVETHSNQYFNSVRGVPVLWCQAVADYGGQKLQVPAVVVRTDKGFQLVLLQYQYHWTNIKPAPPPRSRWAPVRLHLRLLWLRWAPTENGRAFRERRKEAMTP